jgi:hypothetical protein
LGVSVTSLKQHVKIWGRGGDQNQQSPPKVSFANAEDENDVDPFSINRV